MVAFSPAIRISLVRRLAEIGWTPGRDRLPAFFISALARNLSINVLRKRRVADKAADGARTPEHSAESGDEDLERAVARLPWDLRLPLVMYYFDGQDVKTVARRLELSTSGVYLKLRTAIKELHEMLTAQGDTP